MRRYAVDESFFDVWSQEMAYCLGFITADGSLAPMMLRVSLKAKDVEILEYIKKCVKYDGPIRHLPRDNQRLLRICSVRIVRQLASYGVIPGKTGHEYVPDIPPCFLWDYIRGVFDGDGNVYHTRTNYFKTSIVTASLDFATGLRDLTGYGTIQNIKLPSQRPFFSLVMGHYESLLFRDKMYTEGCFSLSRKREIFYGPHQPIQNRMWKFDSDYLRENFYKLTTRELAAYLGRTEKAVREQAKRLGLRRNRPCLPVLT